MNVDKKTHIFVVNELLDLGSEIDFILLLKTSGKFTVPTKIIDC